MIKYAVEFKSVSKKFGAIQANDALSFQVKQGSIHAIIGENGAGKSTAMKLLYGMHSVDQGTIKIHGQDWGIQGKPWSHPSDAIKNGIGMVHQHFMLAPRETVLDNILLDSSLTLYNNPWTPSFLKILPRKSAIKKLSQIANLLNITLPIHQKVQELPTGLQQRVEIVKLLFKDAEILILDEPTAVLSPHEAMELFEQLKKLANLNKTIILITHKLKEVLHISDEVTIMRAGKVVGHKTTRMTNTKELANLMVGEIKPIMYSKKAALLENPIFEADCVSLIDRPHLMKQFSITVHPKEIVGIAGVEGSGQKDFFELIIAGKNAAKKFKGQLKFEGQNLTQWSTAQLRQKGVAFVADDRLTESIIPEASLLENFLLGLQHRPTFQRFGIIQWSKVLESFYTVSTEYQVRPNQPYIKMLFLSGGNQQKMLLARELYFNPKFIILAQPTRGVDIGASQFIHEKILQHVQNGAAALLASSELDEILTLSDEVAVICAGQLSPKMQASRLDETTLGLLLGGVQNG